LATTVLALPTLDGATQIEMILSVTLPAQGGLESRQVQYLLFHVVAVINVFALICVINFANVNTALATTILPIAKPPI
jgi:hypothetical protein